MPVGQRKTPRQIPIKLHGEIRLIQITGVLSEGVVLVQKLLDSNTRLAKFYPAIRELSTQEVDVLAIACIAKNAIDTVGLLGTSPAAVSQRVGPEW